MAKAKGIKQVAYVDVRGLIYLLDRVRGLHILERM